VTDIPGAPIQPPLVSPKKTNPWIIAILVVVVVCCGCFGVVGLLIGFWDPIQQAFGLTTLTPILQGLI
jgi:hypothetical protein